MHNIYIWSKIVNLKHLRLTKTHISMTVSSNKTEFSFMVIVSMF